MIEIAGVIRPLLIFGSLSLAALGAGWWLRARRRPDPSARERQRRLEVNARGRTAPATITEARDGVLYYSYSVRGVQYEASQEVSGFQAALPADLSTLIGPAVVKYLAENPANSMILCEEWSGLRQMGSSALIKQQS